MALNRTPQQAAIIWGGSWDALREGRKILPTAIHSDLRLFDAETAQTAPVVAVLKGHARSEACAEHYTKIGAKVHLFEIPEAAPEPAPKKAK